MKLYQLVGTYKNIAFLIDVYHDKCFDIEIGSVVYRYNIEANMDNFKICLEDLI